MIGIYLGELRYALGSTKSHRQYITAPRVMSCTRTTAITTQAQLPVSSLCGQTRSKVPRASRSAHVLTSEGARKQKPVEVMLIGLIIR
jgi:hypothetical protein